jgi:N6-adenosine-specific RNA methylase IME4
MVHESANSALGRGAVATKNDRAAKLIEQAPTSEIESPQALVFDYAKLDASLADFLKTAAGFIRKDIQRLQVGILDVGKRLLEVKENIGHGNFGPWINAEFQMSADTAGRFMNVARRFPEIPHGAEFAPTVLYELAAPSTPETVRLTAVERARSGEVVTLETIRTLKEIAASPDGRRAIKQVAKVVRAEDLKTRHTERQQRLEEIAERNPVLPAGRLFSLVLIDVPRHHDAYSAETGSEKAPENHYPTIPFHELCDFSINSFAAPDAIILYWSTAASLLDDLDILAEWGFVALRRRDEVGKLLRGDDGRPLAPVGGGRYGSHQIWRKRRVGKQTGMGRWFFDQHEILIVARRGKINAPIPGTQAESVFDAPVGEHSVKPHEDVRGWVDRCWPDLTKIEVFARGEAPRGWVFWGNQANSTFVQSYKREAGFLQAPIISSEIPDMPTFLRRGHPDCNFGRPQ